jgi:peptidoglycan/LPS O-acetylase OafA/YrhL
MTLTLQANQFRAPKWLVLTGDASFSLYLLHTFLLSLAGLFRFNHLQGNATLILVFSVLMPVGITLLSVAWFKSIEYPLMRRVLHR